MVKKFALRGVIIIVLFIIGFIFLLRGCLAAYDERSAIPPALYFENNSGKIVFTIIKFEEATSYKSGGGITQKSVSTSYFIQVNDVTTGERLKKKKLKHHSDIKNFPIVVWGNSHGKAWIFMGEPMAFDPFTLEKFADKKMIEEKNPMLKGKLPEEKSFYEYKSSTNELMITTTDGIKYSISTVNLMATIVDEESGTSSPIESKMKELEKKQLLLIKENQTNYENFNNAGKLMREKKISESVYYESGKKYNRMQDSAAALLNITRDEINDLKELLQKNKTRQREIENLNDGTNSFRDICVGSDTLNEKWYGLLSTTDLDKFDTRFQYRNANSVIARNKLYSAAFTIKDQTKKPVELEIGEPVKIQDAVYLQGGFLLNKTTAVPIHLQNEDGFIICSREKVGEAGSIILSRVNTKGNPKWTLHTGLTQFLDWIYTSRYLIILGVDNKELTSNEANLLYIIDLQTGTNSIHDYFTDKMRK